MPDEVQQVGPHAPRTSKVRGSGKCQLMVLKAKTGGGVHIVVTTIICRDKKTCKKSYRHKFMLFSIFPFPLHVQSVFVVTNSPFGRFKRLNWEASLLRPTHGVPLLACEMWGPRATRSLCYIYILYTRKKAYPRNTLFISHVFLND